MPDDAAARPDRDAAPGWATVGELPGGRVERVLVLVHSGKRAARELAAEVISWLRARVRQVDVESDVVTFGAEQEHRLERGESEDPPDLVVVLGGDGALLSAVRAFRATPVPTIGINLGRVGFLASTPIGRWRETLDGVLEGRGVLEHRMRLRLRVPTDGGGERVTVALNDVVVSRNADESMLRLRLSVGGDWVTDYRADGLIVATPSGSTGYSLSAGGPILAPSMLGLVVTPICSQGLANRPLVLHPDSALSLRVESQSAPSELIVDGQLFAQVDSGRPIEVTRHPVPFPLLSMPGLDPFRRLRERLGWGGDVQTP